MRTSFRKRILSFLLAIMMVIGLAAPAFSFTIAVVTTEKQQEVRQLVSSDGLVTISYGSDAGIPDNAAVTSDKIPETDPRYNAYYQSALAQVTGNFTYASFYDIKIVASDGVPVKPQAFVCVSINQPDIVGTPVVLHFEEADEEILEPMVPLTSGMTLRSAKARAELTVDGAIIKEEPAEEPVPFYPATEMKAEGTNGGVVFETDGFSVFGCLSYTVDFQFNERFYSMPGGSSILLSDLFSEFSMDVAADDVVEVVFTDPNLLGIVNEGEDWKLNSLKPFNTEETLTITLLNGDQISIKVTDAQEIVDAEKETIDPNKSYLICYEVGGGVYYLLKNDGSVDSAHHPNFAGDPDAIHDFEHLNSTYTWSFSHIFKEQDVDQHLDKNYYLIRPIDNRSKTLTLNIAGEALVQNGNNNIAVIPDEDGGFTLEGYHNIGTEEEHRYIHLGFSGGTFVGVDDDGVIIHVYEMDSLPTYDYTVRSADETRGTVTVSGGTEETETNEGVTTHYYAAASNHDKKNAGTITATPISHLNQQGQQKWMFDHWELNGLALDHDDYPATINVNTLSIPYNGTNLVAYFRQNPYYNVPPEEKEPSSLDNMAGWLEGLENREIPLDSSSTKKTAEVYDYQNRIYRIDLTSKANFQTFTGNIDMAFCLDVSNSMYFPSKLEETTTSNYNNGSANIPIYQINGSTYNSGTGQWVSNKNWLDTSRGYDNPYYLIADASGTATVFKVYYKNGSWRAIDASRTDENQGGQRRYIIFGDSNNGLTTNYGQDSLHPFTSGDNDYSIYTIYDAGDNRNNRFHYLNQSLSSGSTDLNTITDLLAIAGDASPNVRIAYNTFNAELGKLPNGSYQRQDFLPAETLTVELNHSSGGGTRPDKAFEDAQTFTWRADYKVENGTLTATDRYVILVTDGAPQGGAAVPNGSTVENEVRLAAQRLKDNSHIKLITVGLSMENVTSGKRLLYDLADKDKNGEKMFYMAESASDLTNIFRQITKVLMEDAIVIGDIKDSVGEAFYLVDKATGLPLVAGDKIDIDGNLTKDENKVAGVVQEDGKTVKWVNQAIDTVTGWHGVVYVKSHEEFLGGNAVKTNNGDATVEAKQYHVGSDYIDFDTSSNIEKLKLTHELPSPLVNVNELTFFDNNTEWTVYLGTEVDPKKQLKALYDALVIEEVVNKDGSLHYALSPNSIDERWSDVAGTEAATFSLPGLIEQLIRQDSTLEDRYFSYEELNWDRFLEDILANGGITLPYHEYGLTDSGNLKITLEKTTNPDPLNGATESDSIPGHKTTVTGDEVEKYILKIAYEPDYTVTPVGQGGQSTDDFHTGTFGTMYQGHAAGRESSTNTHIINVYSVPLDVYKTDGDNQPLAGATFKLYKEDAENGEEVTGLDSTKKYIEVASATSEADGVARLKHEGEDFGLVMGENYYLIETEAPDNYTKVNTVWEVEVQTEVGKYTDLDGNTIYSAVTPPEPDTAEPESPETDTTETEDTNAEDTAQAAAAPIRTDGYVEDSMYPFNWEQGSRIMLDGKEPLLVIAKGETEGSTVQITDGSFVSHKKAISFRHTVLNLIGGQTNITLNKVWNDNNDPNRPNFVTVTLYRVSEKDHVWGEGIVVPSTCTAAGNKEYTCSVCGETKTEVISAAGHTSGTPHRENEVESTCTEAGGYDTIVRCTVCNAIISSEHTSIEALGHDPGEPVQENYIDPTYSAAGSYDEVVYCTRCGDEISRRHVVIPKLVPPSHTVTVYFEYVEYYYNWPTGQRRIATRSGTGVGDMTIQWEWDRDTNPQYLRLRVEDLGTSSFSTSSSGNYSGATQTLTITNITEDLNVTVRIDNYGYAGTNSSLIGQPTFAEIPNSTSSLPSLPKTLNIPMLRAMPTIEIDEQFVVKVNTLRNGTSIPDILSGIDGLKTKASATCGDIYYDAVGDYTISGPSWTLSIPDLPQFNEYGKTYTYYVMETSLDGYETTYSGQDEGITGSSGTVEIVNRKKLGSLKITKAVTVNDLTTDTSSITDGTYEFSISGAEESTAGITHNVKITFANGRATSYQIDNEPVQNVNGTDNTWSVVIPNLIPGRYTVSETNSGNLTLKLVVGGETITDKVATVLVTDQDTAPNTAEAQVEFTNNYETIDVTVKKVWIDNNNTSGNRPSSLKVTLSNGTEVNLNDSNEWSATITGLPKYNSEGQLIEYTWTEETIGNGYTLISTSKEILTDETGYVTEISTLTNGPDEHYNPKTSFVGTKIWRDDGSIRPEEIVVILYSGEGENRQEVARKTLEKPENDTGVWSYEFTNIPVFDAEGNVIVYSVDEVLPNGYSRTINTETSSAPGYERDEANDKVYVNEPNNNVTISTGVNLGFVVIKHGNDFIIWTPRKATDAELTLIKKMVAARDNAIGDSEFSQILSRPHTNVYGVPSDQIKKGNMTASVYMDGDNVVVAFGNKNWSQLAWGELAYTYTKGNTDLINTQVLTEFEFTKKWLDLNRNEIPWDQDIELTVSRLKQDGTQDNNFVNLVYIITKESVPTEDGTVSYLVSDVASAEDYPILTLTVSTVDGIKKYNFSIVNLPYASEEDGVYRYYVKETNSKIFGYYDPKYETETSPSGLTYAPDGGVIINQQEGGAELPSTGGRGSLSFVIAGAVTSIAAGAILYIRKQKEDE